MELGDGWNKLGGGRWSWMELGARFSNTHCIMHLLIWFLSSILSTQKKPFQSNPILSHINWLSLHSTGIVSPQNGSTYFKTNYSGIFSESFSQKAPSRWHIHQREIFAGYILSLVLFFSGYEHNSRILFGRNHTTVPSK